MINNFLTMKIIFDKGLFVIGKFRVSCDKEPDFLSLFQILCQNIFKLLIKERIPIDIQICFDKMDKYNAETFNSYFEKDKLLILKEYKEPKYHSYCKSLPRPKISFVKKDHSEKKFIFRIKNVERLDVA